MSLRRAVQIGYSPCDFQNLVVRGADKLSFAHRHLQRALPGFIRAQVALSEEAKSLSCQRDSGAHFFSSTTLSASAVGVM